MDLFFVSTPSLALNSLPAMHWRSFLGVRQREREADRTSHRVLHPLGLMHALLYVAYTCK